jgi:flagellar basal-body rod protein FlgB
MTQWFRPPARAGSWEAPSMFDKLTLVSLTKGRMDWIAKRQEVLAENIANANTPNYVPRDLKAWNFKDVLGQSVPSVGLKATDARHITPPMQDPTKVISTKKTFESSADGNAVVLEEQMAKMGQARSSYEVAAGLFEKQFKLLRTALSKGQ